MIAGPEQQRDRAGHNSDITINAAYMLA